MFGERIFCDTLRNAYGKSEENNKNSLFSFVFFLQNLSALALFALISFFFTKLTSINNANAGKLLLIFWFFFFLQNLPALALFWAGKLLDKKKFEQK